MSRKRTSRELLTDLLVYAEAAEGALSALADGLPKTIQRASLRMLAAKLKQTAREVKSRQKPPYVLVTVSGGIAEVFHRDEGCEIDIFDFDNWKAGDCEDEDSKARAMRIAERLPSKVGVAFLKELK